ncbi:MAG: hypothetical protein PHU48_02285 [Candidatus Cloacimonetes bacterium]|nr:hypothetical protein [Candidatus Cloacimonadota bacterium]
MKKSGFVFIVVSLMLACFVLFSCKESSTEPSGDVGSANQLARDGMELLNETMLDLEDTEEVSNAEDLMNESTFNLIESKFTSAISLDGDNPMANLGMGILEIVRINYDQELWDMIDEIRDTEERSGRVLKNQIHFLAETPTIIMKQMQPTRGYNLEIKRMQDYVIDYVLPRLQQSLNHLTHAVALADSNVIYIDTGEETMEVDCGEIYAFRAAVNMIYAAFNMVVAYDMDLKDENNSYQWITDLYDIETEYYDGTSPHDHSFVDGHLTLYYYEEGYGERLANNQKVELIARVLQYNIENHTSFGTLRNTNYLSTARNAIINAANDVRDGAAYILDEDDYQANDIIKIENINSINEEFSNIDEGDPLFMQDWTCIADVANWLQTILTENYQFTANDVDFHVNLSVLFSGTISDVRDNIPFYSLNEGDWIYDTEDGWGYSYSGSYSTTINGVPFTFENVNYLERVYKYSELSIGEFTDEAGNPIAEDELPYFPDYTFNGLFPDMTRAKFIELFE